MVEITVDRLGKTFEGRNGRKDVLRDVSTLIRRGEVVAIRGDNGTGKTTLLNILAGTEMATTGTVKFSVAHNEMLRVGYVQQDYTSSLLPWFNVLDNVAIPLRIRGIAKGERRLRASELLDSLGFKLLPRDAYPYQLSGGQKQRVAVARALIADPHLLILDEPFANLDAHTIRDLQESLSRLHEARHPTILFVSHDLDQVFLADRVLLLNGSPATVVTEFPIPLQRPRNREMILGAEYGEVRARVLAYEEGLYAKAS